MILKTWNVPCHSAKKKESDTKGRLSLLNLWHCPKVFGPVSALKGQFRNASVLNGANWEDILRRKKPFHGSIWI